MTRRRPTPAPPPDAPLMGLDVEVVEIVRQIHALELQLARKLDEIGRMDGFIRLGFSNPGHYGDQRGIGPIHRMMCMLRMARQEAHFPGAIEGFLMGSLHLEKVAALTRVATPQDEPLWCTAAKELSTMAFQQQVRQTLVDRGELPPLRRRLVEISDPDEKDFETARDLLNRTQGRVLPDGEAVGELSRHYIACRDDRRRRMHTVATMLRLADAPLPEGLPGARHIPAAVVRAVWLRDGGVCRVPGCPNVWFLADGHVVEVKRGGTPDERNLTLLCGRHNQAHEEGRLVIRGTGRDPTFLHADGRPFGAPPPGAGGAAATEGAPKPGGVVEPGSARRGRGKPGDPAQGQAPLAHGPSP